ncbi:MAG: ABC transporter permease [Acidobacteria bacterium]|nr:MAG: ABC transporter permease [Acidobacteriota bacterium]
MTNSSSIVIGRDLLFAWTARTIRARYQQSILGWLWAIAQPAASVTIYTIVFTRIVKVDTGGIPYPVFSYVAVVPWAFLAAALNDMTSSLVQNINLVQKIYFPREILPIAAACARLMDFGIAFSLLMILMMIFQVPITATWVYLPLLLVIQMALATGIGLACAALNVFYRDIQSLLTLVIHLWFYASPIIYPVSLIPAKYHWVYFLNPMAGIIQGYRDVLLLGSSPGPSLLLAGALSFVVLFLGYWLFKRLEPLFADLV